MIIRILLLIIIIIIPTYVQAAYQPPECIEKTRLASGQTRSTYEFKGSAGEPTSTRHFVSGQGTTNLSIREWVADTIAELDKLQTVDALPALQRGATPNPANRAVAAKTAKQVWREKFDLYLRIKDSGIAAIAGYIATLKADIEATYQEGYLTD